MSKGADKFWDNVKNSITVPCPNCDDGCLAENYCEGCDQTICVGCFAEHNDDAECHVCGQYPERDAEGNLTEKGCAC